MFVSCSGICTSHDGLVQKSELADGDHRGPLFNATYWIMLSCVWVEVGVSVERDAN